MKTWWTPKGGYDASEYEDAYSVGDSGGGAPLRLAVADGATGATFSALWANLLATDFTSGRLTAETFPTRVPILARDWARRVQAEPLPWYAQAKVSSEGSHAALLGITLSPGTGNYIAMVIGDCIFFHLRPTEPGANKYRMIRSFPYARWSDFNGNPVLIGTKPTPQASMESHILLQPGTAQAGDVLYLMSDALGAWFLREIQKERSPWQWLSALDQTKGDATLTAMVRELRDNKRLKNDDVTVIQVKVIQGVG